MGFLDIFKKLFAKKEPAATSPSEVTQEKVVNTDGQFATPQNTANNQPGQLPTQPPNQTPGS